MSDGSFTPRWNGSSSAAFTLKKATYALRKYFKICYSSNCRQQFNESATFFHKSFIRNLQVSFCNLFSMPRTRFHVHKPTISKTICNKVLAQFKTPWLYPEARIEMQLTFKSKEQLRGFQMVKGKSDIVKSLSSSWISLHFYLHHFSCLSRQYDLAMKQL